MSDVYIIYVFYFVHDLSDSCIFNAKINYQRAKIINKHMLDYVCKKKNALAFF